MHIATNVTNKWRVSINVDKSTEIAFSIKRQMEYTFRINKYDIEVVKAFKCLGVPFSQNESFYAAKSILQIHLNKQCSTL